MKHRIRHFSAVALAFCLSASLCAQDTPRAGALDSRVKMLVYNESQVYKLIAYYGYQIDLQMADNEDVKTIAAGDSVAWQIVGAGQHIFIKPMIEDARTNLSIVTSRRTYVFDLVAKHASSSWDMTYLVRFRYPETNQFVRMTESNKNTAQFNFDYKIRGPRALRPTRVFDDGQFTYFQFDSDRDKDLPAIFLVDAEGKEGLVNYRMEGPYVIVERLGETFRLRSGSKNSYASVTNVQKPPKKLAQGN